MNTPIFDEVVKHFGGVPALAKALGIKPQAIYQWEGVIPPLRACQIEQLSGGKFQAADMNPEAVAGTRLLNPPPPQPPERRSGQDRRHSANRRAEESPGRRQDDRRQSDERRQGENRQEETDAA